MSKPCSRCIFEFNHIDKSLTEEDVKILKHFYSHYHKKYWCYKKCYKRYKFLDDVFIISGISLVAIGTIVGGITLNPCCSRSCKWCWSYCSWNFKKEGF